VQRLYSELQQDANLTFQPTVAGQQVRTHMGWTGETQESTGSRRERKKERGGRETGRGEGRHRGEAVRIKEAGRQQIGRRGGGERKESTGSRREREKG
jgi:hypothetical protein